MDTAVAIVFVVGVVVSAVGAGSCDGAEAARCDTSQRLETSNVAPLHRAVLEVPRSLSLMAEGIGLWRRCRGGRRGHPVVPAALAMKRCMFFERTGTTAPSASYLSGQVGAAQFRSFATCRLQGGTHPPPFPPLLTISGKQPHASTKHRCHRCERHFECSKTHKNRCKRHVGFARLR